MCGGFQSISAHSRFVSHSTLSLRTFGVDYLATAEAKKSDGKGFPGPSNREPEVKEELSEEVDDEEALANAE